MKKLTALRQHLIRALPTLQRDPDHLLTFIEDGTITFTRGPNLTHEWQYCAQLVFVDFAQDTDVLTTALIQWLRIYEPDQPPEEAISIEAEITSETSCDLLLRVRLSERVIVSMNAEKGILESRHLMNTFDDDDAHAQWALYQREGETLHRLGKWTLGNQHDR